MNGTIVTNKYGNIVLRKLLACLAVILCSGLAFSCVHRRRATRAVLKPQPDWNKLKEQFRSATPSAAMFARKGPYSFELNRNLSLTASPDTTVQSDFYRSRNSSPAPIVIISHGNGYNRLAHVKQAETIASWGFHCLIVDLPNRDEWRRNGVRLRRLSQLIYHYPQVLEAKIDRSKIFLVGHSFGGSASVLAAAKNPMVAGLVLLDPAVVHEAVTKAMHYVVSPVALLGADKKRFRSRRRRHFYKHITAHMVEVSIAGATHEDAQYPSINTVHWGFDFKTSPEKQKIFLGNLVVSLFSMSMAKKTADSLKFAWSVFERQMKSGSLSMGRLRVDRRIPKRSNMIKKLLEGSAFDL